MRTTSLLVLPRATAISLPFGSHTKLKITPELKSVTCCGAPPSIGCRQTFDTPARVSTKSIASEAGLQRITPAPERIACEISNTFAGWPPLAGTIPKPLRLGSAISYAGILHCQRSTSYRFHSDHFDWR